MDILERYLQAVRFWLPQQQKHDIIAELSEDIYAQIEDRETELGRQLKETEVEEILKQRGRPVLVANGYLPQEHLIGPVLFPIYRFVLKIVFLFYLLPWLLVAISLAIFGAEHGGFHSLAFMSRSLWFTAFVAIGTVTLVFGVLERVQAKSHFLEKWEPRKLPPVRNPNLIKRSASSFELAANLVCLIWWAANMSPLVLSVWNLRITLSALWPYFFWGFLCVALVNTTLAAVNLMRPYWTGLKATVRLLSDCAGAVLFCWLLKANILMEIVIANVSSERALEITDAVNLWMARMLPGAVVVAVGIVAVDVYRMVRVKLTKGRRPWEASVMTTTPL